MVDIDIIPAEQEKRLKIERKDNGEVIRANSEQPLIDWLYEVGTIDDDMYREALEFAERMRFARRISGAKVCRYGDTSGGEMPDLIYGQIIVRMRPKTFGWCEGVIFAEPSQEMKQLYRGLGEYVRFALNDLIRATNEAKEHYKNSLPS